MAYMPTSSTFCTEESVEIARLACSLEHADLITVLAASQRNHVDFVPILWQKALGSLGKGGTANVSQALLNLQTSFAFKRTSEYRSIQFGDRQKGPAEILTLEISILKHPPIQKHPNIVDLEGVCWEITDKNDVYPVLLFEKAEQGNLLSFVPSLYGESVSFGVKLGLCTDIINGVQALHNANIIHGDIKPENILVFGNRKQGLTAKVCDFGHSSVSTTDEDIVYMPCSRVWAAPEYHDRGFTVGAAKKMDIYSLGLVTAYLLFHDEVWDYYINMEEKIHRLKRTGELLSRVKKVIWETKSNDQEGSNRLQEFFERTLACEVGARESNLDHLIALIGTISSQDFVPRTIILAEPSHLNINEISHANFNITELILSLTLADYRVRKDIVAVLALRSGVRINQREDFVCEQCKLNAAFQMAVCHKLGFGAPANHDSSQAFLKLSGREELALENDVASAKQFTRPVYFDGSESRIGKLFEEGFLFPTDFVHEYQRSHLQFSEFEGCYLQEISDLEAALGNANAIPYTLKLVLAKAYKLEGKFQKAEEFYRAVLEHCKLMVGVNNVETSSCMDNLAQVLWETGKLSEAEELQRSALDTKSSILGKNHLDTLTTQNNLCITLALRGRSVETEAILKNVFYGLTEILGPEHPETLVAMHNYAITLRDSGNLKFAESLLGCVIAYRTTALGSENQATLRSTADLSITLNAQGKHQEAENMIRKSLDGFERTLGINHLEYLQTLESLASIFGSQGKWTAAYETNRRVLDGRILLLGEEHPDTLVSREGCAIQLGKLDKWGEAEVEHRKVKQLRKRILGPNEQATLRAMENLAHSLGMQNRWAEAEKAHRKAVFGRERVLGEKHWATLQSVQNLARAVGFQHRWSEARILHLRAWEGRQQVLGSAHPLTMDCGRDLAAIEERIAKDRKKRYRFWSRPDSHTLTM